MLIAGIILLTVGFASWLYGFVLALGFIKEDLFKIDISFFKTPDLFWIIAGTVVLVIGFIFISVHKKKNA